MRNSISLIALLFSIPVVAQNRQLLHGRAISDFINAGGVVVSNTAAQTNTVTDTEGNFSINVQMSDTLVFSGDDFHLLRVVVKRQDLQEDLFVVKLELKGKMLDEVKVGKLTGNLAVDSKSAEKLKPPEGPKFDAREINKELAVNTVGGMNFIAIAQMLMKKKPAPAKPQEPPQQRPFSQIVREIYPREYFVNTLNIPAHHIKSFVEFCDKSAKRYLLDPRHETELVDFLKIKSEEFLKQLEYDEK